MNIFLTDRIKELAKKNGTTIKQIEKDLRIANKSIAVWDTHRQSFDKVAAVADYFGVSIDTLCGRSSGEYLSEDERQLLALFRSMNAEGKTFVMQLVETASERYKKTAAPSGEVTA